MLVCRRPARANRTFSSIAIGVAILTLLTAACGDSDGADAGDAEVGDAQVEQGEGTGVDSTEADTGSGTDAGGSGAPGSSFDGTVTVIVPNTPGTLTTIGQQRVMAALLGDGANAYLGGPDQPVTIRFSAVDSDLGGDVDGSWLTTNASALGLYVAPFAFEQAGLWEVTVLADGAEVGQALIEVVEDSPVPSVGEPAPTGVTPTAATAEEVAAISTDPAPDPTFYDLSLDEALANGKPTVVAFATPAFCQTALCGPTIETVKAAASGRDDIDVVHIEPFDIELATQGVLDPIPMMDDWGLITEPWVFLVDADGMVAASYEGMIGTEELKAAIARL